MSKKKKIKKFDKLLRKYQENRDVVKINRTMTEGEANVDGIILEMSDEFMHLVDNYEFRFNGEIIIKMNQFDSIRSNEFDKAIKRILTKEKLITKSKPKRSSVDLSSWKSIFTDLKKSDIHVIVECENLKEPTFIIGPIEKIKAKTVEVRFYDAAGILADKTTKIKYKDITLVRFNDDYSTTFRKYLKK